MAQRDFRWYISREECKRSFLNVDSTITAEDTKTDRCIRMATMDIERYTGLRFLPYTEQKFFDHPEDDTTLVVGPRLLSITTFTTANTDTTVTSGQYYLMCGDRYDLKPYDRIVMKSDGGRPNLYYSGTPQKANAITGVWGWTDDFENTGTTLDAAISSTTATTFTSSDGSSLETGWTLLIDSEQLFVSDIDGNTVTVKRGQGGTTAATHTDATAVYRYPPPFDIEEACGIIAARLYERGATAWADIAGSRESGLQYAFRMPEEARAILEGYKWRYGSAI